MLPKFALPAALALLMAAILACGSAAEPTATAVPTAAAPPTQAPAATATPVPAAATATQLYPRCSQHV